PSGIRRDDLEAVTDRQAAIRLGVVGDHHLDGRWLATSPTSGALEIGARVLYALMDERDVLCIHSKVDAKRDTDRVGRSEGRHRAVGVEHQHLPEDADVLEPGGALDEWPHVQAVRAGKRGRLKVELEPCDLPRPNVRRRLQRDAVKARPSGRGRSELTVAPEDAWLILSRFASP